MLTEKELNEIIHESKTGEAGWDGKYLRQAIEWLLQDREEFKKKICRLETDFVEIGIRLNSLNFETAKDQQLSRDIVEQTLCRREKELKQQLAEARSVIATYTNAEIFNQEIADGFGGYVEQTYWTEEARAFLTKYQEIK